MENFMTEHFGTIIVAIALLGLAAVLYFAAKGKYRKVAKQILLSLVVTAEKQFGGGTGAIKYSYVSEKLYEKMPNVIQLMFSANDIANMIEDAVDKMKEFLADNPEAASTITGAPNIEGSI